MLNPYKISINSQQLIHDADREEDRSWYPAHRCSLLFMYWFLHLNKFLFRCYVIILNCWQTFSEIVNLYHAMVWTKNSECTTLLIVLEKSVLLETKFSKAFETPGASVGDQYDSMTGCTKTEQTNSVKISGWKLGFNVTYPAIKSLFVLVSI